MNLLKQLSIFSSKKRIKATSARAARPSIEEIQRMFANAERQVRQQTLAQQAPRRCQA